LSDFDGPAIGDRAPDVDFQRGSLFDRLRHPYFTLLVMPSEGDDGSAADSLKRRFGRVLDVEVLPRSEALSERYGASDGRLFLVRPDGYIAFKSTMDQGGLLEARLGAILKL
jgi:hypothetical protein